MTDTYTERGSCVRLVGVYTGLVLAGVGAYQIGGSSLSCLVVGALLFLGARR